MPKVTGPKLALPSPRSTACPCQALYDGWANLSNRPRQVCSSSETLSSHPLPSPARGGGSGWGLLTALSYYVVRSEAGVGGAVGGRRVVQASAAYGEGPVGVSEWAGQGRAVGWIADIGPGNGPDDLTVRTRIEDTSGRTGRVIAATAERSVAVCHHRSIAGRLDVVRGAAEGPVNSPEG